MPELGPSPIVRWEPIQRCKNCAFGYHERVNRIGNLILFLVEFFDISNEKEYR